MLSPIVYLRLKGKFSVPPLLTIMPPFFHSFLLSCKKKRIYLMIFLFSLLLLFRVYVSLLSWSLSPLLFLENKSNHLVDLVKH